MASIKIDLRNFLVNTGDGFDLFNRPQTYKNIAARGLASLAEGAYHV